MFKLVKKVVIRVLVLSIKIPLRLYFGYDKWHDSSYFERPYTKQIVQHLNKREERNYVLEIGCGTGSILRRLDFVERLGLDYDTRVLNALVFMNKLSGQKLIQTKHFNFLSDQISGNFDVIVLVNWIHEIKPTKLRSNLNKMYSQNLCLGGEIIIDTVGQSSYRHNHNIEFLTKDLDAKVILLGEFEFGRKVYSIKHFLG